MEFLAPLGRVYQAGTLSGNPVAVAAGIRTLKVLKDSDPYKDLEKKSSQLCKGIELNAKRHKIGLKVNRIGSMFSIYFIDEDVIDYKTAKGQDLDLFKAFFHGLLKEGVYLSPSGFEADFLSTAHSDEGIEETLRIADKVLKDLGGR